MPKHSMARQIFQFSNCSRHLSPKHLWSLSIDKRVRIAVSSHFVTGFGNLSDDFGMALGYIPENKKCCASSSGIEDLEYSPACSRNPILILLPLGMRYFETLIPILEIDCECVGDLIHCQSINSRCHNSSIISVHNCGEWSRRPSMC